MNKQFVLVLFLNGLSASSKQQRNLDESLLYQETQSTYDENGGRIFTMPEEESGSSNTQSNLYEDTSSELDSDGDPVRSSQQSPVYDDSLLHDEAYSQQNGDSQFTDPQDEVFLGSLSDNEFCSSHSMCQSTCCQEPYLSGNRRVLQESSLLYQETRNVGQDTEPVMSESYEVVYNEDADNILFDESNQGFNEDGSRYFTSPSEEMGSSEGSRKCVPKNRCDIIQRAEMIGANVERGSGRNGKGNKRSGGKGGKQKVAGASILAALFCLMTTALSIGICVQRYHYRKLLSQAGLQPIQATYEMDDQQSPSRNPRNQGYNVQASATSSASQLDDMVNAGVSQTSQHNKQNNMM